MEKLTPTLAIIATVLIVVVNIENVNVILTTYGPPFLFRDLLAQFLFFLVIFWVIEKIYFKIKPKKKSRDEKQR